MSRPAHLSAYGLKIVEALESQGDPGSKRAGKKRRIDGTPLPSTSNRATPQLGHPSGLSQNINGSDKNGQKARTEFVSRTLNSATTTNHNEPPPSVRQPAAQSSSAQVESAALTESVEDADMSDALEEDEGEIPEESVWLEHLKNLYNKRPNNAMQATLLTLLEQLSKAEEDGRGKPRGKRGKRSDDPWEQDEDYICTDGPRRREKIRVLLSGYIRIVLGQFLNVKDSKTPLPHGPPAEVAAPTASAFYVRWNESENSEFNQIAARIVARRVVSDYPKLGHLGFVQQMATTHLKYLRARYRRQTNPAYIAKEPERLRSSSAATRKRTLYDHRLRIINAIPALARHGRLIETLGLEGTSSDEEDTTHRGTYIIKRRKQLSLKVNHLKRKLDLAYSIHFKGPGSQGNQLRKRIDIGKVSNRRLKVMGLPTSCMDPVTTLVSKGVYFLFWIRRRRRRILA
ncbi:hypothetical protein RhiJN_11673 [Ceratobasidium sp. AG-Ba]|nr:hypothetical protein RhiJN_11673 [Ceratobasidium sp. AG-Ba]